MCLKEQERTWPTAVRAVWGQAPSERSIRQKCPCFRDDKDKMAVAKTCFLPLAPSPLFLFFVFKIYAFERDRE